MHIRVTVEHFIQKPSALICCYNCLQSCGKYFQDSLKPHCRNLLLLRHQNVKVRQWCGAIWSASQSVLQVLPKVLDSVEVRGLCRLVKAFHINSRNRGWFFFCTCFMLLKRGEHFLKRNCKKESALLFSPLRTKVLLNSKKLDSNEPGDVHLPFGTVNICVSDFSAAADYALPANHLLMISHLVLIICRLAALTTVSQITRFI